MQLTLIDPSVLQLVCSSRPSPSLSPTRLRPRLKSTSRSSGLASGSLRACTGGSLLRSRRYCCWRTRVELIRVYVSSLKLRSPPPYESLGRAQVQRPSTDRGQRSARHPSLRWLLARSYADLPVCSLAPACTAVANGATAIAEGFLLFVGVALIAGEAYRSSRSASKRRDTVDDKLEDLLRGLEELRTESELRAEISEKALREADSKSVIVGQGDRHARVVI